MKFKSILAISLLVILGFVLGFFTAGRLAHHRIEHFRDMMNKPNQEKEHIVKRLELTNDQVTLIQPVLDSMLPQMHALRKNHTIQMDSLRKEMFDKIRPNLTPVQLKKVDRMQQNPPFRPPKRNLR